MADIVERLQNAMHLESAAYAPQTTPAIEAMREARAEIERLREAMQTAIVRIKDGMPLAAWTTLEIALEQKGTES